MATIYLIRHAKPSLNTSIRVTGTEFPDYVHRYDDSGVDAVTGALSLAGPFKVFCSELPRSVESAKLMFPDTEVNALSVFREAALPTRFPGWMRMRFSSFTMVARSVWLLGMSQGVESRREATSRAEVAAAILQEAAADGASAVLVGHGYFNALIGKRLRSSGWRRLSSGGYDHGAAQAYQADF